MSDLDALNVAGHGEGRHFQDNDIIVVFTQR